MTRHSCVKPISRLLNLCLLLSGLAASLFASSLAATALQLETVGTGPTAKIGDIRFVPHMISVQGAAVAAGDVDHDGHPDLISGGDPLLTIFRGDGQGGLAPFSHVPGGQNPVDFALADLNEDGNIDLVVANHDTDYLTLLLGDGQGFFQPAANSPLRISVRPHPHAVRAADLDTDGHVDLIVDHREAEGLLILRGLGNGQFATPGILVAAGGDPYRGMAVGDLNNDGKPDIVTPNPREVGILRNTSDTHLAFSPATFVAANAPFAVALGDFNGDGNLDLLAASDEGSSLVELFWGDGRGSFEEATGSPVRFASGGKKIAVGDFNTDGMADAVVSSYFASEVLVILGRPSSILVGSLPVGEHPWSLTVADLNGDARDDIVVGDDTIHQAWIYLSLTQKD